MFYIITFILGALIGGGFVWVGKYLQEKERSIKVGLIGRQKKKKRDGKNEIIQFMEESDRIANKDVEKLLGVSDATAERYLNELEKEGILKQIGDKGNAVFYKKT
jgi:Fic family protein